MDKKRVVVIGGGTGTHTVLRGLKRYQKQLDLSAIVTMADSGGSTGRLRDEFGFLPVGDVRMALAALASDIDEHEELLRELFLYRFDKGQGLSGHNFGNLLLVALTDLLGSEEAAIRAAARVLRVQGQVIPVTTQPVHLVATYSDGSVVTGEHLIDEPADSSVGTTISKLTITPAAPINPAAEKIILDADVIILGPGDLYTSVLANCVVDGVANAIKHSKAKLIYISNLMTKRGQTDGFGVAEHLKVLTSYLAVSVDTAIVNTSPYPEDLLKKYAAEGEYPVRFNLESNGIRVVPAELLATEAVKTSQGDQLRRSLIRHDPQKLARVIMELI